jgi:hypothetical protein
MTETAALNYKFYYARNHNRKPTVAYMTSTGRMGKPDTNLQPQNSFPFR